MNLYFDTANWDYVINFSRSIYLLFIYFTPTFGTFATHHVQPFYLPLKSFVSIRFLYICVGIIFIADSLRTKCTRIFSHFAQVTPTYNSPTGHYLTSKLLTFNNIQHPTIFLSDAYYLFEILVLP